MIFFNRHQRIVTVSNRAANAPIKGYYYQFDHTIVLLLSAESPQTKVVVEGIEDVDLENGNETTFVQCKYYQGSNYSHSLIKGALIQMLKHFHAEGCPEDNKCRYRLYGHYKSGMDKLPQTFDLDFFKKKFLTYKKNKTIHEVHNEIGITDHQLNQFQTLLEINVRAPSYEAQQIKIRDLLMSQISGCQVEDAETFYYPSALNVVRRLAIKTDEEDRRITKAKFLAEVNRKEEVFTLWLRQKFGDAYYAKFIKFKHFKFALTRVPSATRIFLIDVAGEFDISKAASLLAKLGKRFSHIEHRHTPPEDRFCPYVFIRGLTPADLVSLKASLLQQGVKFADGYPFKESEFYPAILASSPTRENQIKLKFIPSPEQISPVVAAITGSSVKIFNFFKSTTLDENHIPPGVEHHSIKVCSAYFISEVIE